MEEAEPEQDSVQMNFRGSNRTMSEDKVKADEMLQGGRSHKRICEGERVDV